MFASSHGPRSAARRRGIVLVLVLGMLGLMALIGVTFATFAGQSLKSGRNFSQGLARPQPEALMDYALAQLINDTNNPLSAIRGHSLLRDMYGNDSVFRGSNPPANSVAETGGLLSQVYNGSSFSTLHFTGVANSVGLHGNTPDYTPFYNQVQYVTNIPLHGQYQGYDFTRWIIRFPGFTTTPGLFPSAYVGQTFEVIEDDFSGSLANYHVFTLSANLVNPTSSDNSYVADNHNNNASAASTPTYSSSDWTSFIYGYPNQGATFNSPTITKNYTHLLGEFSTVTSPNTAGLLGGTTAPAISNPFVLDGRYMRAFNGPGLTRPVPVTDSSGNVINVYPFNQAAYGNMRIAGYNPDSIGMDEDYDACDLENWFLAIQSADGQVMVPSFHRPGILTAQDWTLPVYDTTVNPPAVIYAPNRSKILRPRQIDNSPLFPADPSVLDANGKLTYDIDNDGDGVTDSVWLDLGYPVQRDPNGKLYKPLFAFMVLGLNGRLPLNTVGNLQSRAIGDNTNNTADNVPFSGSSGQAPYPGPYPYDGTMGTNHHPQNSSQVFFDTPTYDHASHLGYSVNEINPKFALQNAPSNLISNGGDPNAQTTTYTQYDDAGVSVALTQLRNILSGARPTTATNPYLGTLPASGSSTIPSNSGDVNVVAVKGLPWIFPNGLYDLNDIQGSGTNSGTAAVAPAVAGRWGEPEGIPNFLPTPFGNQAFDTKYPIYWYHNLVRAGRSQYVNGATDAMDDDFDSLDPYLPGVAENSSVTFTLTKDSTTPPTTISIPLNATSGSYTTHTFNRYYPEDVDSFDNAGQRAVASERMRLYVTPQDPAGVGRMVSYLTRPASESDYGLGADGFGRTGFFRYFRPAGMPQEVRYPYSDATTGSSVFSYSPYVTATTGSGLNNGPGQRYLLPFLVPPGQAAETVTIPSPRPDRSNNLLHGLQAAATPTATTSPTNTPTIAVSGTMPYDYDQNTGTQPIGYLANISLYTPTINPINGTGALVNSRANSINGPNLGATGDPVSGTYPIPYGGTYTAGLPTQPLTVNGYLGGSLNKDEADEMNLYTSNTHDMPYSPSDLEWLYRKHDVDGATLNSRLAQLAPISFLNPADGLTRRRLFSTDSWELNRFAYANDNPIAYAGTLGGQGIHSTDHDFTYNSRFMPSASPSLEIMNQVVNVNPSVPQFNQFANPFTTEFLPNPTLPTNTLAGGSLYEYLPNSSYSAASALQLPLQVDPTKPNTTATTASLYNMFSTNAIANAKVHDYTNVIIPLGGQSGGTPNVPLSAVQVATPSLAHLDRKINLNFPLPISNDPAEPVRQKWCRETYQMLKAILPPAAVDTPEELAALSQFVVNIIDFRDPDCTATRFVNTDLEVVDVLTKRSTVVPQSTFDTTWNVSPPGVRFVGLPGTTPPSLGPHFPYDPSLYSPDVVSPFLVQHGMEYSPIAINEALALQGRSNTTGADNTKYRALFVELVNTLTESQNGGGVANSSAISLAGWDMIFTPDNYGWGRPDPVSGEVNPIAYPPNLAATTGAGLTSTDSPSVSQRPTVTGAPSALAGVQRVEFRRPPTGPPLAIKALSSANAVDYFVVGAYDGGVTANAVEKNPIIDGTLVNIDVSLDPSIANSPLTQPNPKDPATTSIISKLNQPTAGTGLYYWVYLRRPANPFDTELLSVARPNREMVVVDAMRFPYIDSNDYKTPVPPGSSPDTTTQSVIYSAQRLQPYRGGHLLPQVTSIPPADKPVAPSPAAGTATICPPSPPYAYGYSEQMAIPVAGTTTGKYTPPTAGVAATKPYYETIGAVNSPADKNWVPLPLHDRDFASVAELLLVPSCPPGLFTKQFVEEAYPGNYTSLGTDNSNLASPVAAPVAPNAGRPDFNVTGTQPPAPTFPYLTDNFYYTAASVAPPLNATSLNTGYKYLTTEIGGWTGAGWHKMLEFFEVPSSANGAIGTAAGGDNYDWYRSDVKPGLINLNLIIDEEVFAGLIDDPRLNENLAVYTTTGNAVIPQVVSQVDTNGYPMSDSTTGIVTGRYPMFPNTSTSINALAGGAPSTPTSTGRGYIYRDPDSTHYSGAGIYQQLHGMKAAFSDFLKLRHGGSGYLFAHGGGDVGMGDYIASLTFPLANPTQAVAADRPYRSMSYPDINYTIMRPASLPPSPANSTGFTGTFPPLPIALESLLTYNANAYPTAGGPPFVELFAGITEATLPLATDPTTNSPLAPMNETPAAYQYVQDSGIKNPFIPVQFVKTTSPKDLPNPGDRRFAPPYEATVGPLLSPPLPIAAPFPPPIPPTPTRRLFQIPDFNATTGTTSNASDYGAYNRTEMTGKQFLVNQPVSTRMLYTGANLPTSPPTLVPQSRAVFAADNYTPLLNTAVNNYLGANSAATPFDLRQHPVYRTEMLQKISNLTTVRTHQFATWITVGFFEVVKTGTPELGIPDVLGQELGSGAGKNVRYRSFFVLDRTKATGFNPYYPGNFRDCVTYRRRIE